MPGAYKAFHPRSLSSSSIHAQQVITCLILLLVNHTDDIPLHLCNCSSSAPPLFRVPVSIFNRKCTPQQCATEHKVRPTTRCMFASKSMCGTLQAHYLSIAKRVILQGTSIKLKPSFKRCSRSAKSSHTA
eukprot:1153986-Pelagomonas_calceolata.AAC.1